MLLHFLYFFESLFIVFKGTQAWNFFERVFDMIQLQESPGACCLYLLGYFLNHLELSTRMYIHRASRIQILRILSENLSNILNGNPPNKTFRKSPSLNHLTPLTVSAPYGPECYSVGGFFAADFSSTTVLLYRKWVKCLFIFNWICSRSRSTSLCPKLYIHRMYYTFHFWCKGWNSRYY